MDGNVRRVLSRLFDRADPPPAWLRPTAAALVDPDRPGDWNQALMDLGRRTCVPGRPDCGVCPWEGLCEARRAGTVERRPGPARRAPVREGTWAVAVVEVGPGEVLVARRPEGGLLAGLWGFPDKELPAGADPVEGAVAAAREAGVRVDERVSRRLLPPVRHRFTHVAATYLPVLLGGEADPAEDRRAVALVGPGGVALPVAHRKIADAAAAAVAGNPLLGGRAGA